MMKYLCVAIVLLGHSVPLLFRLDIWPLSDYPMFSEKTDIHSVSELQVFQRHGNGSELRIPMNPAKFGNFPLNKALATQDVEKIKQTLRASLDSSYRTQFSDGPLILYRTSLQRESTGKISKNRNEILRVQL